jgi:putative ABC transport system permease protein
MSAPSDLRLAFRQLRRTPAVTLTIVAILAVGIGATTTMISVAYAALVRPLPFPDPGRLATLDVTRTTPRDGLQRTRWSRREVEDLVRATSSFEAIGSYSFAGVNLTSGGDPERIDAEVASPGYFRVLGVTAQQGRTFLPDEDRTPGGRPVVLVSARLWHRRFASDPTLVGRAIGIEGLPLTVVGILPEGFAGLSGRADVWIPPTMAPQLTYEGYLTTPQHFISVVGRLAPGVSFGSADAELRGLAGHVVHPEPDESSSTTWSAAVRPLAGVRVDPLVRRSIGALLGAATCLLLITCVNVAGLLLVRTRTRRRELAIRLAIGAGRLRLLRLLGSESLLVALAGGVLGTLLARWGIVLIGAPAVVASGRTGYGQLAGLAAPTLELPVLVMTLVIVLGTSILTGLGPVLELPGRDLGSSLGDDRRSGAGRGRRRYLGGLVTAESALAMVLLVGSGLLIRSVAAMQTLRAGFSPDHVLTFWVAPPTSRYASTDGPAVVERLLTRVQQVPGVMFAAVNRCAPMETRCARTTVFFPGRPVNPDTAPIVGRHYVSADYFRTLGIPLRSGRALTDADRRGRPPVTVISETAARRFWPGENPIGRHVWFGSATGFMDPADPVAVVGIVGDVKYGEPTDPILPDFYTSYLQFTYPDTLFFVRSPVSSAALTPSLRRAVASVEPGLPIYDVRSLDDRTDDALARPRLDATALGTFALVALALATIGVYSVTAYSVTSRRRELALRLALGADRPRLVRRTLAEGARLAVAGAGVGLCLSLVAARMLRGLLFGVAPADPVTLMAAALVTIAAGSAAALRPAWRAGATDPMTMLRME